MMTIKEEYTIKKQYHSPRLEVVLLDNHVALDGPSEGEEPPGDPFSIGNQTSSFKRSDSIFEKPFSDSPSSDSPFGGSSPSY